MSNLKHHKEELVAECRVDNLDLEDAEKRLRSWERQKREQDAPDRIPAAQTDERADAYTV